MGKGKAQTGDIAVAVQDGNQIVRLTGSPVTVCIRLGSDFNGTGENEPEHHRRRKQKTGYDPSKNSSFFHRSFPPFTESRLQKRRLNFFNQKNFVRKTFGLILSNQRSFSV